MTATCHPTGNVKRQHQVGKQTTACGAICISVLWQLQTHPHRFVAEWLLVGLAKHQHLVLSARGK